MVFQRIVRLEVSADMDFDDLTISFKIANTVMTREILEIKSPSNLIQIERQFTHVPGRVERWIQKLVSGIESYEPLLLIQRAEHPRTIAAFYKGRDRDGEDRILFHAKREGDIGSFLFLISESDYLDAEDKIMEAAGLLSL